MPSLNKDQLTQQYWDLRQLFTWLSGRKTRDARAMAKLVKRMAVGVEGAIGQMDRVPASEWETE